MSLDESEIWNNNTQTGETSTPSTTTSHNNGSESTTEASGPQLITESRIRYAAIGLIIIVIAFVLLFSRR